jgi:fructokinase
VADILVIGEILVEIMATAVGQTFKAPGLFAGPYPSGAPAIFADQAARMGASTAMIGCVGADDFGTLNIERLGTSGVDTRAIRRVPGATTGIAFVTYRADGSRDFLFTIPTSAAAALREDQLEPAMFAGCRWFHLMGSSLFSAEIARAARRGVALARAVGARISFDPNVRKELLGLPDVAATIEEVLGLCDLLLPSEEDLAHLLPGLSADEAADRLLGAGRSMVVLKKGGRGASLRAPGLRLDMPAFPADEVDPTGAGDCFGGTFVACLAQGMAPERALLLATAAGALAVTRKGPMEGNSRPAELDAFLARHGHG